MNRRTVFAFALAVLLAGCNRLTLENYDKIAVGMPYAEVEDLIGEPESCTDLMGVRSCQWGDETRSITVSFVKGKVVFFASSNLL